MKTTVHILMAISLLITFASDIQAASIGAKFHGSINKFERRFKSNSDIMNLWRDRLSHEFHQTRIVSGIAEATIRGDINKLTNRFILNPVNVKRLQSARSVEVVTKDYQVSRGQGRFWAVKNFPLYPRNKYSLFVETSRAKNNVTIDLDLSRFDSLFNHSVIIAKLYKVSSQLIRVEVLALFTLKPGVFAPPGISEGQTRKEIQSTLNALEQIL